MANGDPAEHPRTRAADGPRTRASRADLDQQARSASNPATVIAPARPISAGPGPAAPAVARTRHRPDVSSQAERRAAAQRVSACHQAQLTELIRHAAAAIDRYGSGEIDAYAADEIIQRYHRAAGYL